MCIIAQVLQSGDMGFSVNSQQLSRAVLALRAFRDSWIALSAGADKYKSSLMDYGDPLNLNAPIDAPPEDPMAHPYPATIAGQGGCEQTVRRSWAHLRFWVQDFFQKRQIFAEEVKKLPIECLRSIQDKLLWGSEEWSRPRYCPPLCGISALDIAVRIHQMLVMSCAIRDWNPSRVCSPTEGGRLWELERAMQDLARESEARKKPVTKKRKRD